MEQNILLSIQCLVYNHEPYLRQCLDGFIMQKTNFDYEVVVHDDASTDNSASIISEYTRRYPKLIKPIYESENLYSRVGNKISFIINEKCSGKYIALCEGDDYWTDPLKLQKQINFLEANLEYSMCFHNTIEHYEFDEKADRIFSNVRDADYTGLEIYERWIVPTASVVLRRNVFFSPIYKQAISNEKFIYWDILLFLSCANEGMLRGMSDVMSVYRRHQDSFTLKDRYNVSLKLRIHDLYIYKTFGCTYKKTSKKIYARNCINACFLYSLLHPEIKTRYDLLFEVLRITPVNAFLFFFRALMRYIKKRIFLR
ncbi:MAG: glycosyltransferase [Bacteroides sp.]|nr:glycosyltransferase [Bacteroides sp.]